MFLWIGLVGYSRVYLGYHSWTQVLGGAVAGVLLARGWYQIVAEISPLFDRIQRWEIARMFHVRDTFWIEEGLLMEYEASAMANIYGRGGMAIRRRRRRWRM